MNDQPVDTDNLQTDDRYTSTAKPLNECDCNPDKAPKVTLGKSLLREAYVPPKDFERITKPNKLQSFA
jgi:hypothetical protein